MGRKQRHFEMVLFELIRCLSHPTRFVKLWEQERFNWKLWKLWKQHHGRLRLQDVETLIDQTCLNEILAESVQELGGRPKQKWNKLKALLAFRTKSKGEDWAKSFGWLIPSRYRHVIGDILEDCAEMREAGCTERRIKFHVVYQWLIAIVTLVPTTLTTSIVDAVKQVISPPK